MKKTFLAGISLVLFFSLMPGFARAGGGGVPSPFSDNSNRKVELADGEMYALYGKVVYDSFDIPYLWVDLSKHAWLANQQRRQNPFYRLLGQRDQWRGYEEKSVQLICIAHVVSNGGQIEIELAPVSQPGAISVVQRQ